MNQEYFDLYKNLSFIESNEFKIKDDKEKEEIKIWTADVIDKLMVKESNWVFMKKQNTNCRTLK